MVRSNPKYSRSQSSENATFVLGDDEPKQINGQRWNARNNFVSLNSDDSTSSSFAGRQEDVDVSVCVQPHQSGISSGNMGHNSDIQGAIGGSETIRHEANEREDLRFDIQETYTSNYKPGELENITSLNVINNGQITAISES